MKSLVALLDRKKKDRVTTLVQVPFPSTLPHSSANHDGHTSIHGTRRTSAPSSLLRQQQQHRAASDGGRMHRPLLSEPSTCYPGHAPTHSASYYTESDDGTLVDPFAPSPTKLNLAPRSHHDAPPQMYPRRVSEPNSASKPLPSSYRVQPSQESGGAPIVGQPQSQSGITASAGKKGRWLRERRSLTSLLRPQQPNNPTDSVPAVPPLPNRVPERKHSLFFKRARSGSTPSAAQITERAHTTHQPPTGPEPVQLSTPDNTQRQAVDSEPKNGAYRGSIPLILVSPLQAGSSDSWVRVEGVSQDAGLPTSPTIRRRAVSVPVPLPKPTKPPPLVPDGQHAQCVRNPEVDRFPATTPEPVAMRRPGTSVECPTRPSYKTHGTKSASMSIPTPARSSISTYPREQRRPAPQHSKKPSAGTVEGSVLKSALKHRPVESTQSYLSTSVQPVKPLRICKREGLPLKADSIQLPTPSSESSLKEFLYAPTSNMGSTTQHPQNTNGSPLGRECLDGLSEMSLVSQSGSTLKTLETSMASSTTIGSFGNIMKGHGLPSCDSRSLPVLDNIWGSFISETAFGNSLPPSPVASISARHGAMRSQGADGREQIGHQSTDSKSRTDLSRSPLSESWKSRSAPPSSPPVTDLPPVPKAPPTPALSLTNRARRKRSQSSANEATLLTPPISPTEGIGFQDLCRVIATSTSSDNPPSRSGKKYSTPHLQLGPRLARSASSPSIRPPMSPEIGYGPVNTCTSDAISRLPAQYQNSWPISPSSISQSGSQCTPVPGTPVVVPPLAVNLAKSYPGTSSGAFIASGSKARVPREVSSCVERPESSVIDISTQAPGTGSGGASEAIMNGSPRVQSNPVWPHKEKMGIHVVKNQDVVGEDLREEPLLTPPVTPAWAIHVFDPDTEDNLQFSSIGRGTSSGRIPLARSGNLAQMRRHKRGDMRSDSTQFTVEYSHRPDMPLPGSEKPATCNSNIPKKPTFSARNVL